MLLEAVAHTRNQNFLVAGIVIGFAGLILFLVLFTPERPKSTGGWIGVALAMAFLFSLGGWLLAKAVRSWNPIAHRR